MAKMSPSAVEAFFGLEAMEYCIVLAVMEASMGLEVIEACIALA